MSINIRQDRIIELDRSSVCMGDDITSHKTEQAFSKDMKLSELLTELCQFVPYMPNVIWGVTANGKAIGYIITTTDECSSVEVQGEDVTLEELNVNTVFCNYYHRCSFSWGNQDGETVYMYPKEWTLLEKVKEAMKGFN